MIKVDQALPDISLQVRDENGTHTYTNQDLFIGKKVVVFAVPGAFTPTCSEAHLPGYVVLADKIKAKGVDAIICVSVNDAFVMQAWGKAQNADEIIMAADGDASFSQALGLAKDTGAFGGMRSVRYAMIVDDNVVTTLNVEPPKTFELSKAETILALL
ncbi:peroxiredoxin [Saccharobesus litoralis]|uniref:Glutathione-dependent peroxiredoxin n=1 Tax=Saccharobesus litoralis TaxID=2172099 RepID=A0A2S0VSC5_9ALTE|nr:peroxiredoxin [Saccharobesus litoralis]AWB67109.1 peroxiredoxin [Saccharobesus litoralis]